MRFSVLRVGTLVVGEWNLFVRGVLFLVIFLHFTHYRDKTGQFLIFFVRVWALSHF